MTHLKFNENEKWKSRWRQEARKQGRGETTGCMARSGRANRDEWMVKRKCEWNRQHTSPLQPNGQQHTLTHTSTHTHSVNDINFRPQVREQHKVDLYDMWEPLPVRCNQAWVFFSTCAHGRRVATGSPNRNQTRYGQTSKTPSKRTRTYIYKTPGISFLYPQEQLQIETPAAFVMQRLWEREGSKQARRKMSLCVCKCTSICASKTRAAARLVPNNWKFVSEAPLPLQYVRK